MRFTIPRIALALGVIFGVVPPGVRAQASDPFPDQAPGSHARSSFGTPVDALPSPFSHGGSCVRWCVADRSPCDPDFYKVADRRCNPNQSGYY